MVLVDLGPAVAGLIQQRAPLRRLEPATAGAPGHSLALHVAAAITCALVGALLAVPHHGAG